MNKIISHGLLDCLPLQAMSSSDNINSFLDFIKQNLEELASLSEYNRHLNWEGIETNERPNDFDVR